MACGKKDYTSLQDARRVAKSARYQGFKGLSPYHCRECQSWHIGGVMIKRITRIEEPHLSNPQEVLNWYLRNY